MERDEKLVQSVRQEQAEEYTPLLLDAEKVEADHLDASDKEVIPSLAAL